MKTRFRYTDAEMVAEADLNAAMAECGYKFAWFAKNEYVPHYWQALFHTMRTGGEPENGLCRYRHLVAGRRGGKTMSAAWEVVFYVLHPEWFHWDYHREKSKRGLYVWVVTKDYPTGKAALDWFREVLDKAGLQHGVDYKENRGNRWFEFPNGSFVHFRSAEDPQSLRGAGLDILWMDEAAFIPNEEAWNVSRPALSDKVGMVITTTTPDGKNWLYEEFFAGDVLEDPRHGSVEYRSIDNPYFSEVEWQELLETYHPLMFKQEFMAAFDSMAGKELNGDWLHFYTPDELPLKNESAGVYRENGDIRYENLDLDLYMGIDPAHSLSDKADRFAAALIGVAKNGERAWLIDLYAGRIPFPEQIELIRAWYHDKRPTLIGAEATGYQGVLVQQAYRLPEFVPIVPIQATGKKSLRILAMSPFFRIKRIKIRREHRDFIEEWIDYDSTIRNPKDDTLDAVEIALRTAGVILPPLPAPEYERPTGSIDELAAKMRPRPHDEQMRGVDEHLGGEW